MTKFFDLQMSDRSGVVNVAAAPFSNRVFSPTGLLVSARIPWDDVDVVQGADNVSYRIAAIRANFPMSVGIHFRGYPASEYSGSGKRFEVFGTLIADPPDVKVNTNLGLVNGSNDDIWDSLGADVADFRIAGQNAVWAAYAIVITANNSAGDFLAVAAK